jgi:hypothetical protein
MAVTADEVLRLAEDGPFQDGIIVGIRDNDFQHARYGDGPREEANLVGDLRSFGRVQAALELKFFGEFSKDEFAGQGQAFALASGLDAPVRIPQPADRGEENVCIEDNAWSPVHDSCRISSTNLSRWASVIVSQSKPRAEASRRMSFSPSRAVICHHWARSAVKSVRTRRSL